MLTSNIRILERGDRFTAREFTDMVESRAFNVLAQRIDRMIDNQRAACESAKSLEELREAQGALKALRTVRTLPSILIDETTVRGIG